MNYLIKLCQYIAIAIICSAALDDLSYFWSISITVSILFIAIPIIENSSGE